MPDGAVLWGRVMNCESFLFLRRGDGGRAAIRGHRRGRTVDARV